MLMPEWLDEVRHAVTSIIPLIWAEHDVVEEVAAQVRALEQATDDGYRQAAVFINDFDDDEGLGTAIHWDTYFGPDKERHHAEQAFAQAHAIQEARTFSRDELATSLLQFARRGISVVHGGLQGCPNGRDIFDVELKRVIWEGRNQAIHSEEGEPRPKVIGVFESLGREEPVFLAFRDRSLAFEIVRLLGWRDWDDFTEDLSSLA